jgi:hypothetical protein
VSSGSGDNAHAQQAMGIELLTAKCDGLNERLMQERIAAIYELEGVEGLGAALRGMVDVAFLLLLQQRAATGKTIP